MSGHLAFAGASLENIGNKGMLEEDKLRRRQFTPRKIGRRTRVRGRWGVCLLRTRLCSWIFPSVDCKSCSCDSGGLRKGDRPYEGIGLKRAHLHCVRSGQSSICRGWRMDGSIGRSLQTAEGSI